MLLILQPQAEGQLSGTCISRGRGERGEPARTRMAFKRLLLRDGALQWTHIPLATGDAWPSLTAGQGTYPTCGEGCRVRAAAAGGEEKSSSREGGGNDWTFTCPKTSNPHSGTMRSASFSLFPDEETVVSKEVTHGGGGVGLGLRQSASSPELDLHSRWHRHLSHPCVRKSPPRGFGSLRGLF